MHASFCISYDSYHLDGAVNCQLSINHILLHKTLNVRISDVKAVQFRYGTSIYKLFAFPRESDTTWPLLWANEDGQTRTFKNSQLSCQKERKILHSNVILTPSDIKELTADCTSTVPPIRQATKFLPYT